MARHLIGHFRLKYLENSRATSGQITPGHRCTCLNAVEWNAQLYELSPFKTRLYGAIPFSSLIKTNQLYAGD